MKTTIESVDYSAGLTRRQRRAIEHEERRNTSKKYAGRRAKLWAETGGMCCYCNSEPPEKDRSMDHLWPKAKGGGMEISNLIPACRECNAKRGTKFPASPYVHSRWRSYVAKKEADQGYFHT